MSLLRVVISLRRLLNCHNQGDPSILEDNILLVITQIQLHYQEEEAVGRLARHTVVALIRAHTALESDQFFGCGEVFDAGLEIDGGEEQF